MCKQLQGSGRTICIGEGILRQVCKPGADIEAVGYRLGMLELLPVIEAERMKKIGDDTTFRVIARFPMVWVKSGSAPFDVDEFFRQVEREQHL